MAYREFDLSLLVRLDPKRAAKVILAEYQRTGGNTMRTARALGVGRTTLKRWLGVLENRGAAVQEELDAIRVGAA